MITDELQTLIERRDYLALRAEMKEKLGWESQYDRREFRALDWAIGQLSERLRQDASEGV